MRSRFEADGDVKNGRNGRERGGERGFDSLAV